MVVGAANGVFVDLEITPLDEFEDEQSEKFVLSAAKVRNFTGGGFQGNLWAGAVSGLIERTQVGPARDDQDEANPCEKGQKRWAAHVGHRVIDEPVHGIG